MVRGPDRVGRDNGKCDGHMDRRGANLVSKGKNSAISSYIFTGNETHQGLQLQVTALTDIMVRDVLLSLFVFIKKAKQK